MMYRSKELEEYASKLKVSNVNGIEPVDVTENMKDVFHKVVLEKDTRIIGTRQSGKSLISRIVGSYMFDLGYNVIHLNKNGIAKHSYDNMLNFLHLNEQNINEQNKVLAFSNINLKIYSFTSDGIISFKRIDAVNENLFHGLRKTVVIAEDLDCYDRENMLLLSQIKDYILRSDRDDNSVITTESIYHGREDIIAV